MDDEPLHQFLKSTGWSADDLLKKLEKIKNNKKPDETLKEHEIVTKNEEETTVVVDKNTEEEEEEEEVTEIRVIQIEDNDEEDDDVFIEEYSSSSATNCQYEEEKYQRIPASDYQTTNSRDAADNHTEETEIDTKNIRNISTNSDNNDICDKNNLVEPESVSENDQKQKEEEEICADNLNSTNKNEEVENCANIVNNDNKTKKEEENSSKSEEEEEKQREIEEDELRNCLKLQLNTLRTRKKTHVLQELTTKVVSFDDLENTKIPKSDTKKEEEKNVLYNQASDFGFIIASVHGGVDLEECEQENEKNTKNEEEEDDETKNEEENNVFEEIRKIIRKTKKVDPIPQIANYGIFSGNLLNSNLETSSTALISIQNPPSMENSLSNTDLTENLVQNSKSPFVSDTLDEFLSENSKLNISYAVPKLDAEDGVKRRHDEEPTVVVKKKMRTVKKEPPPPKKEPSDTIKAKTLAEKRKLLEIKEKTENIVSKKLKTNESYVWYYGKKIRVKTKTPGKCLASIGTKITIKNVPEDVKDNVKRPSLLTDLIKRSQNEITYKPGPLSKKPQLIQDLSGKWEAQIRKLPKITLEVTPEIGKPFPSNILHLLPETNWEITENQMELALTALKCDETPPKPFEFDVPYQNNQEIMIVRKKTTQNRVTVENKHENIETITAQVANVLDALITYVETKKIETRLLQHDPDANPNEPHQQKPNVFKKPTKKRTKVDSELTKLGCKVVNIGMEDDNEVRLACTESHCQLGCVCKSLNFGAVMAYHCQKASCIFHCSCPKETTLKLPSGMEVLSKNTVNRIDDEAKKHLAKVEREFTQTIIQTNEKAVLVGNVGKTRRATKIPKKFTDYFNDLDEVIENETQNKPEERFLIPCTVDLTNLHLRNVIPYCLTHNLYNCHCKGTANYTKQNAPKKEPNKSKLYKPKRNYYEIVPISEQVEPKEEDGDETVHSGTKRPARNTKKHILDDFVSDVTTFYNHKNARCNPIPSKYVRETRLRNTSLLTANDFIHRITKTDLNKSIKTDADQLKRDLIKENKNTIKTTKNHRRKQTLKVREDSSDASGALQQRRPQIRVVFDGEIIVRDANWLQTIGENVQQVLEGYARLLPWKALLNGFYTKKTDVWITMETPYRLAVTKSCVKPPTVGLDLWKYGKDIATKRVESFQSRPDHVEQSKHVQKIIKWILDKNLPIEYNEDSLSFLLIETRKDYFEIRGLCTQNKETPLKKGLIELHHKDLNGISRTVHLKTSTYPLQELIETPSSSTENLYMWASLPHIDAFSKWRMVYMNKDFAYLHFKLADYSIKYTDLTNVFRVASREKRTVFVKNDSFDKPDFGMYFEPHYDDRVFIGPYPTHHNEEDVQTLRFINKTLVDSVAFNLMQGKSDAKCSRWLVERPFASPSVDLTGDDETPTRQTSLLKRKCTTLVRLPNVKLEEVVNKRPLSLRSPEEQLIFHNNVPIYIKSCEPRLPEQYNRFIVTNIPHFGYLGAYQADNSQRIEVSWPFEKKVLEFENVNCAKDFLQDRFGQLLQPVPETFKIEVIVLLELDLSTSHPIFSDFLTGHCICGEFGTLNIKDLSDEFCSDVLKTRKDQILTLFAKRAQGYLRKKIEELAELANINNEDVKNYNIANILQAAVQEIKSLENTRRQNAGAIRKYEEEAVKKMKQLYQLLRELPQEKRNVESKKFNETLQMRPNRFTNRMNEVIEIGDSDDETVGEGIAQPQSESSSCDAQSSCDLVKNCIVEVVEDLPRKCEENDSQNALKMAEIIPINRPTQRSLLRLSTTPVQQPLSSAQVVFPRIPSSKLRQTTTPSSNASTNPPTVDKSRVKSKNDENNENVSRDLEEVIPRNKIEKIPENVLKIVKTTSGKMYLVSKNSKVRRRLRKTEV